jgi:hypothetical protein
MPARNSRKERGWQVFRMRGASMLSLGIVYAVDEADAVKKAAEEYGIPAALQNRLVAKPWQ